MVASGLSVRRAAESLKIHHSTVAAWRAELPDFDTDLAAAESKFVQTQLANVQAAADKGTWQASAWMLERRLPAEYSQPQIQLTQNTLNLPTNGLDDALRLVKESPAARALLEKMLGEAGGAGKIIDVQESGNQNA